MERSAAKGEKNNNAEKKLQTQAIALSHEGHQGGEKTLVRLRKNIWFRKFGEMVRAYTETCNAECDTSNPHNVTPPLQSMVTPEGPWEACAVDHKEPIGGKHGWYLFTIMDLYSYYLCPRRHPQLTRVRTRTRYRWPTRLPADSILLL